MKTQLVIFGITGDLAERKLLPALHSIIKTGEYDELSIIGVSRREVEADTLVAEYPLLVPRTSVFTMDLADAAQYDTLKKHLEAQKADQTLFYLSVPPGAAASIVDLIGQSGMNTPNYKILFEKPFGFDLASAQDFIGRTSRYFKETQLYRIDHYMAKEISKHLITLRNNADTHHHTWGSKNVQSVTIRASEEIDIEGRVQFYEQTGALRDFVQGHLLQLLSLVLMDPTKKNSLSHKRLDALRLLQPAVVANSIRAQYEGYSDEVQNTGSVTETFVQVEFASNDPQWESVPLTVVTGKALNEKRSCILIQYRDGSQDIFDEASVVAASAEQLDAYERVLIDAINNKKDIFITSDEVLRSWEIVAPLQDAWSLNSVPLHTYPKGASIAEVVTSYPNAHHL